MQLRQHHRVTTVSLHPVARLHRDQRRGNYDAVMPHLENLAMKAIAARTRLIAEMQPCPACRQPLRQLAHMIGAVRHRSPVADLPTTFALRDRHRNRRLVDIQPDERAILHLVSPPFLRLGARQPGAILERRMPRERPPTQSVHTAIMGSKGLGKQVVVAVHERALFEYLTLELSPAFAGDSLITVEISRNFAGDAVADPHFYAFEDDKVVAA